jgi:hypothetical protein
MFNFKALHIKCQLPILSNCIVYFDIWKILLSKQMEWNLKYATILVKKGPKGNA